MKRLFRRATHERSERHISPHVFLQQADLATKRIHEKPQAQGRKHASIQIFKHPTIRAQLEAYQVGKIYFRNPKIAWVSLGIKRLFVSQFQHISASMRKDSQIWIGFFGHNLRLVTLRRIGQTTLNVLGIPSALLSPFMFAPSCFHCFGDDTWLDDVVFQSSSPSFLPSCIRYIYHSHHVSIHYPSLSFYT